MSPLREQGDPVVGRVCDQNAVGAERRKPPCIEHRAKAWASCAPSSDLPIVAGVAPESPELARLLRLATRSAEREMMDAVARVGLDMLKPRHMTLLRVLDPGSDGTRISDLARDADVSRQAIQQVVVELAGLGIVETVGDPSDARARLVRYTPFGLAGFRRCMREFAGIERAHADRLGARRMSALKEALRDLLGE